MLPVDWGSTEICSKGQMTAKVSHGRPLNHKILSKLWREGFYWGKGWVFRVCPWDTGHWQGCLLTAVITCCGTASSQSLLLPLNKYLLLINLFPATWNPFCTMTWRWKFSSWKLSLSNTFKIPALMQHFSWHSRCQTCSFTRKAEKYIWKEHCFSSGKWLISVQTKLPKPLCPWHFCAPPEPLSKF